MKKDTGIIPELGITEELRDKLAKRDWSKPQHTTDPNNPDNWTTAQCVEKQFSGFRVNGFTDEVELWVLGYLRARTKRELISKNPGLLATMHEEVFQTGGTLIEIDTPIENQNKQFVNKDRSKK